MGPGLKSKLLVFSHKGSFKRCFFVIFVFNCYLDLRGVRWPGGRPSASESRGPRFNPHMGHRVLSLSKTH